MAERSAEMKKLAKQNDAGTGQAPKHLRVMWHVLEKSSEFDKTDSQRGARRWFLDDPVGFMKRCEESEIAWGAERRQRRQDRLERRAARKAEEEQGQVPPSDHSLVPVALTGDEGQERAVSLAREVLKRLAGKAKEVGSVQGE